MAAGLTSQQSLPQGSAACARGHPLPADVRTAAWALLGCRTAVLGGHLQAWPAGHVERLWYHACRQRVCPQWSWLQIERWLIPQKARLLACAHDPVSFTVPDERRGCWLGNRQPMTARLLATVRATRCA